MKLKNWTFYKATNLLDVEGNELITGDFFLLVLRPDILEPNRILGFGIEKEFGTIKLTDLQNKEMTMEELNSIFSDKIGVTLTKNIEEIEIQDINFSTTPVRKENISKLIEIYNVFIKTAVIEFDTQDYDSKEKIQKEKDEFTELDLESMSINQLLTTINSGMNDYYKKMSELRDPKLEVDVRIDKTMRLATLQSNLILFYDATLRRMDTMIADQHKQIEELKKQK